LKPQPSATGIANAASPVLMRDGGIAFAPAIDKLDAAASAIQAIILVILRPFKLRSAK
jgi:hypothetical protein